MTYRHNKILETQTGEKLLTDDSGHGNLIVKKKINK